MGQKANPNSLRLPNVSKLVLNNSFSGIESSGMLKERFFISSQLTTFFEKKKLLVKENFFQVHNEKSSLLIFFSIFELKTRDVAKRKNINSSKTFFFGARKILSAFSSFGYFSSKRLFLQNLNKISLNYQKTIFEAETKRIRNNLKAFKKEKFFEPAISLFCLLNTMKGNGILVSKFIAFFFKMCHKSRKKSNKFKFFLTKFVQSINSNQKTLKGLKILIKGRFNRSDRSKKLLFEKGTLPNQVFKAPLGYYLTHLSTSFGVFGIHVWVFD